MGQLKDSKQDLLPKDVLKRNEHIYNETFARVAKMVTSYADTSLLTYKKDNDFLALVVYVDDILLTGNNLKVINHIKHQLDVAFSIKDSGNLNYYMGIEFLRNDKGITMTQRKYALELSYSADVLDLKPSHIQVDPIAKLNETDGDLLIDPSQYRALV
nr:retrovirus-related Pol polyprotein from transposon TNT 1-94 [Tanacetum cinerariifolium]